MPNPMENGRHEDYEVCCTCEAVNITAWDDSNAISSRRKRPAWQLALWTESSSSVVCIGMHVWNNVMTPVQIDSDLNETL